MSKRSRFQRGAGGVFSCCCCGRKTRLVSQPFGSETCPECDELAMQDNSVNDGAQTWEETKPYCEELLFNIVKKGGNAERVKADFDYLWPKEAAQE